MVTKFFDNVSRIPVGFWLGLFLVTALSAKFLPALVGVKLLGAFGQLFPA